MKKIILFIFAVIVSCNAQPNSSSTFEVGIVNPQPGKFYRTFVEFNADTTIAALVEGMDFLNPDVSGLEILLTNQHQEGDTLFGEVTFQDLTFQSYSHWGLIQVDSNTNKYSAMKVSGWFALGVVEVMNASFFIRRKQ